MAASAFFDEPALIARVQRVASPEISAAARGYSAWGEHALGWIALGALGTAVDRRERRSWVAVAASAISAHGAAVVIKRIVRRARPSDSRVEVRVSTPSNLSFPSAHAASTTAAAFALAPTVGATPAVAAVGTMALARVILGVHYPSDVAAGTLLGVAAGVTVRRLMKGVRG